MEENLNSQKKPELSPQTKLKLKKIKKVESYALYIGLISIFIAAWIPVFSYVSTLGFAVMYVTALIKQKLQKGRIKPLSFLLCTASLCWIVLSQFVDSPYVTLFGQVILYSYLMESQKELLGKVHTSFMVYAVSAVALGVLRIYYPSKLTNTLNIIMQLWILYRFLDPILENIGQAHRKKRLAEEKKHAEEEAADNIKETEVRTV